MSDHLECRPERVPTVPGPIGRVPEDGHDHALVNMGGCGGEHWLEWYWWGRVYEYLRVERVKG